MYSGFIFTAGGFVFNIQVDFPLHRARFLTGGMPARVVLRLRARG